MIHKNAAILLVLAVLGGCSQQEGGAPEPARPPETAAEPSAPSEPTYSEKREACADRNPLRNPYFGELHVHTGFSMDAYAFDVRTTPDDAYRFARGE